MKEQYIKQVEKELRLPRKAKQEVLRDLREAFASASEHGETEQQVVERLGSPKMFAESTMEQFGIDGVALGRRRGLLSAAGLALVAVAAFGIYAAAQAGRTPEGVIGQADAMTGIQVTGGFDVLPVLLAVGVIAGLAAVVLLLRAVRRGGRDA